MTVLPNTGTGDTVAPTVLTFSPLDEATGVAVTSNILLTFSESIRLGTGNIVLKNASGAMIETYNAATSANVSISGSILTINPTVDLGFKTGYTVEFSADSVEDIAGNSFAGITTYNFTTVAASNSAPTGAVTIVGTPTQGQTLRANAETLADANGLGALNYQWQAAGVAIAGASAASYTLTQAEVGKAITVTVSYTDGIGTVESKASSATASVNGLNSTSTTGSTELELRLLDTKNNVAGIGPLKDSPYDGFSFNLNGELTVVRSHAIDAALTYGDLLIAIKSTMASVPSLIGFTAALGSTFTTFDPISGQQTIGTTIILSGVGVISLDSRSGWISPSVISASSMLYTSMKVNATVTNSQPGSNLTGSSRNDTITSTVGNDAIDGGSGIDTGFFSDTRASHTLTKSISGWNSASSAEGTDTLTNVERLQFTDKKLALDLSPTEHAGQALEFIGLMAPNLINTPSVVGLILGLFDQGKSLHDVCQLALDVALVNSIAGSNTNAALAAMAFRNVIGVEADAGVVDMLVSYMDGRSASYSQADFMAVVAGLEVNQAHIGLVGLQQTGIEYV